MNLPRFQVSLQRLLVAVALFAVLFGCAVAFWRLSPAIGYFVSTLLFSLSVLAPVGYALKGWSGGLYGGLLAVLVWQMFVMIRVTILSDF